MSKAFEKSQDERKRLTEQIIKNLENGGCLWKKGWDYSLFNPYNPNTNSVYRGYNKIKLMIEAQEREYKDPRWMTYKQAQEKGWQVVKEAKGVSCEFWKFEKEIKEKDHQGNEITNKVKLEHPIVNNFTLFNAIDIDGIPELPQRESLEDSELKFVNNTLIRSSECEINETATDRAFYRQSEDKIYIPIRESFGNPQEFTATLIHEMAHSTGHPDRLNREKGKEFGDELYAKEELRAELSAVFVQNNLNLDLNTTLENHSAYVGSWIKALKDDYNEIYRAAAEAEKISDRLISNYRVAEKERIDELLKSPLTKDPFRGLVVTHHYSEAHVELGVDDNTTLRGKEAYRYLEKVIAFDKKIHQERDLSPTTADYYKTKFSYKLNSYEKDNLEPVRFDLGDGEFGGYTKVSDALEYRFKLHLRDLESRKDHWCKTYDLSDEEFSKQIKADEKDIDNMIKTLKAKELKHEKSMETQIEGKIILPGLKKSNEKNSSLER